MSLYKQNNLLDINNLFECQNNLKLKDNIFLDNDDINIEGGNIRIDNFIYQAMIQTEMFM